MLCSSSIVTRTAQYFWTYIIIVFFILFNILLAILVDAWVDIKDSTHRANTVIDDHILLVKSAIARLRARHGKRTTLRQLEASIYSLLDHQSQYRVNAMSHGVKLKRPKASDKDESGPDSVTPLDGRQTLKRPAAAVDGDPVIDLRGRILERNDTGSFEPGAALAESDNFIINEAQLVKVLRSQQTGASRHPPASPEDAAEVDVNELAQELMRRFGEPAYLPPGTSAPELVPPEPINVDALSVAELKQQLQARGIPLEGLLEKQELKSTLQVALDEISDAESEGIDMAGASKGKAEANTGATVTRSGGNVAAASVARRPEVPQAETETDDDVTPAPGHYAIPNW